VPTMYQSEARKHRQSHIKDGHRGQLQPERHTRIKCKYKCTLSGFARAVMGSYRRDTAAIEIDTICIAAGSNGRWVGGGSANAGRGHNVLLPHVINMERK
jgi:hypothetical protein